MWALTVSALPYQSMHIMALLRLAVAVCSESELVEADTGERDRRRRGPRFFVRGSRGSDSEEDDESVDEDEMRCT